MKNKTLKKQPARNTEAACILRQKMTPAEKRLWQHVRNNQLGHKIRRQYAVIGTNYVADFCCPQIKLIIEIDGSIHDEQQEEDADRQTIIEEQGFQILRFRNAEVFGDLEGVLKTIKVKIEKISPHPPAPLSQMKRLGEGEFVAKM